MEQNSTWGPLPGSIDLLLSTARLNKVVAHRHGDLTATVEAGATLSSVNAVLAEHGQWLPLDPAWSDRATIGGIVATNDSGPGRHRHGAPRDLIIGCSVALSDGRIAKSGGIVVKNVAGYDLARLFTGSTGSNEVVHPRLASALNVLRTASCSMAEAMSDVSRFRPTTGSDARNWCPGRRWRAFAHVTRRPSA